mmetsp:Transcript_119823/g.207974  ORF Transcript_119823/g.207974 Transcript_119823/m.207974 type:complete len:247 (-) Transcript_119823:156-896(-)
MGNCCEGVGSRPKKEMTLKYFPIAGRCEPIRLALLLGKFKYKEERLTGTEWENGPTKKSTPYGQLPVLIVNGYTMGQSKTILRYLGKLTKFKGKRLYPTNAFLSAQVDEVLDAFDDFFMLLAPTYKIADKHEKEDFRRQLFSAGGQGANFMDIFEKRLQSSKSGWVVSEAGLTVADLVYFGYLCMIRSGSVDGLNLSLFSKYRKIMEHKDRVARIPEIQAYYKDKDRSNPKSVPYYEVFLPSSSSK